MPCVREFNIVGDGLEAFSFLCYDSHFDDTDGYETTYRPGRGWEVGMGLG